jgi:hypothetical protein
MKIWISSRASISTIRDQGENVLDMLIMQDMPGNLTSISFGWTTSDAIRSGGTLEVCNKRRGPWQLKNT